MPKHIKHKILCGVDSVDEDSSDSQGKTKKPRKSRIEDDIEAPDQQHIRVLSSS